MAYKRRDWMAHAGALAAVPALGLLGRHVLAQRAQPQVVQIKAERFHYTPREFQVKAGMAVLLEFTSKDFLHCFHLPDLRLRADLVPGVVTRLRFTVDKPGTYVFLCDNFCGDGHEEMGGKMVVTAA